MQSIKVWGGTHPNEQLGLDVAADLMDNPVAGVEAGIVNLRAHELRQRFVAMNMNDGYPGDLDSKHYEERRAVGVLQESQGYFAVLDLHANNAEFTVDADFAAVGKAGVRPEVYGFLARTGFRNIVLLEFNALVQHVPNSFLVDIALSSHRSSAEYWRDALSAFAQVPDPQTAKPIDFTWYRYARDLHIDQLTPEQLTEAPEPFDLVTDEVRNCFDGDEPLRWLVYHLDGRNLEQTRGYWAELGVKIDPPF